MTDGQKKEITALRQEGLGYTAVARRLGVPRDTVRSFCRRNGLAGEIAESREDTKGQPQDGSCRECGKALLQAAGVKRRVFCSKECREKWWHGHPDRIKRRAVYPFTCAGCGGQFTAYGNAGRKYCSHACYIKSRFKGGGGDE